MATVAGLHAATLTGFSPVTRQSVEAQTRNKDGSSPLDTGGEFVRLLQTQARQIPRTDGTGVNSLVPYVEADREERRGTKGAFIALDPDNPEFRDVLFFSRYPTGLQEVPEHVIVSREIPGRSHPVIQRTGGNGAKFRLQAMFYDAFLTFSEEIPPAAAARLWAERHIIRGDNITGLSVPDMEIWYQQGNQEPIRVEINSIQMDLGFFDIADNPQRVDMAIEFQLYVPVELISPFKPKKPRLTKKRRRKVIGKCTNEAQGISGSASFRNPGNAGSTEVARKVIEAALSAATNYESDFGAKALRDGYFPEYVANSFPAARLTNTVNRFFRNPLGR